MTPESSLPQRTPLDPSGCSADSAFDPLSRLSVATGFFWTALTGDAKARVAAKRLRLREAPNCRGYPIEYPKSLTSGTTRPHFAVSADGKIGAAAPLCVNSERNTAAP